MKFHELITIPFSDDEVSAGKSARKDEEQAKELNRDEIWEDFLKESETKVSFSFALITPYRQKSDTCPSNQTIR